MQYLVTLHVLGKIWIKLISSLVDSAVSNVTVLSLFAADVKRVIDNVKGLKKRLA